MNKSSFSDFSGRMRSVNWSFTSQSRKCFVLRTFDCPHILSTVWAIEGLNCLCS